MRTLVAFCSMLVIGLLASCAAPGTSVVSLQRLDKDVADKLAFDRVEATSSTRRFTPEDLDELKAAVAERLPRSAGEGVPATVLLAVKDYGPGGSKLVVAVNVVDAKGKSFTQFEVYKAGSSMLGTVFDQRSAVIKSVADSVARSLMALPVAPPATFDTRDYGS